MNALFSPSQHDRLVAARAFLATALLGILAGGLIAGVVAHAPTRPLVWMAAYLVLVVGLAQAVLGAGQAWLPVHLPSRRWRIVEWLLLNAGNAGVIIGTLCVSSVVVSAGTAMFAAALIAFLLGVRDAGTGWLLHAFRAVLIITCVGACTGLVLTLTGIVH